MEKKKKKAAVPLVCHSHSRPVVDLFYSPVTPDGYFLISASKDSNLMLCNGETGGWIGTFEGHKRAVWSCCLDTNALRAASGSADSSAKVWDALTGDELHSFEHKHIVRACAFSKDTHLLLTGGMEKILRVYDLNRPDAAPKELAKSPASIRTVAWLHNDQTILSSCTDTGGVRLWDVRSEKIVQTLETKAPVTSAEVSQDGRFITTADGSSVKFWDANNFGLVKSYDMSFTVESASLEPKSGSKFIAGGEDMWVHVFDFVTGEEITCNKHDGPVHCVRFAPGGESYSSGSEDGTIRIWPLSPANTDAEDAADADGKTKVIDKIRKYILLLDGCPNMRYDKDGVHVDPDHSPNDAAEFAFDSNFLEDLVNPLVRAILATEPTDTSGFDAIVEDMHHISSLIQMVLETFGDTVISVLAYRTDFIQAALKFLKLCKENDISMCSAPVARAVTEWILTVPLFSLVFKYILGIVGCDEFYCQHVPFSLDDSELVVIMLKEALWDLCCTPMRTGNEAAADNILGFKKLSLDKIKNQGKLPICELLMELQDWNLRQSFTSATNFVADKISEDFISEAVKLGTQEYEIVKFAPFLIPFNVRAAILEEYLKNSRSPLWTELSIRRNHLLADSDKLSGLTDMQLKGKLKVNFVDQHGLQEDAVDLGGPYREFLVDVCKKAFSPKNKMMEETRMNLLYPNPESGKAGSHLKRFQHLGTILGKALFDRVLIDLPLAPFFIRKLKQKPVSLHDMISFDAKEYAFLRGLKTGDDISKFYLSAEEYIAGGQNIELNGSNAIIYAHLRANHLLNTQIEQQSFHFLKGFHRIFKKEWTDLFNEYELQLLISGHRLENGLDIDDMRKNTIYAGYKADDPTIRMFWDVLSGLSRDDQKMFLKFVTGQSCVPFDGFGKLEHKFKIDRDAGAIERLPSSSTCFNNLHLPPYDSEETLRDKLLQAIKSGSVFALA